MSELQSKINRSVKLLKVACGDLEAVELCYSGGKDSDVILTLAQMADIPYRAIYKKTTIDPPGTIRHCYENGVEIIDPKKTFFEIIRSDGMPTSSSRHCCKYLKEYKILDNSIQGIRRCESTKRSSRYKEPIVCRLYNKKDHVNVILPILDWTDDDVAEFINANGIQCHSLYYDENGMFHVERRLGCIGCPMASRQYKSFQQHPGMVKAWLRNAQQWWDKPRKKPCKSQVLYKNVYELFVKNVFCESGEDFKLATTGMFGNIDCKAWLEEYFKIEL